MLRNFLEKFGFRLAPFEVALVGDRVGELVRLDAEPVRDVPRVDRDAVHDTLCCKEEERRQIKILGVIGAIIAVGAIMLFFLKSLAVSPLDADMSPRLSGNTADLGRLLFTSYLLPFEIVSILILVAVVGVVLLSKKGLK